MCNRQAEKRMQDLKNKLTSLGKNQRGLTDSFAGKLGGGVNLIFRGRRLEG